MRATSYPRVPFEAMAIHRLVRRDTDNATDEARYCDGGEMPEGVVCQPADATDVANDQYITIAQLLLTKQSLKMVAAAAIAQAPGGAVVYSADDGKVTGTNTGVRVGRLVDTAENIAGDDGDYVEVIPDPAWVTYATTAASTLAVAADTNANPYDQSFTIPANTLKAGDVLDIRAFVRVIDQNSTNTLTLRLLIGTVVVSLTGAVQVADDDIGILEATVTVRSIGATGKIFAAGKSALDAAGTALGSRGLAEATLDTTADQAVTVTAEWSAAHADNESQLEQLTVTKLAA